MPCLASGARRPTSQMTMTCLLRKTSTSSAGSGSATWRIGNTASRNPAIGETAMGDGPHQRRDAIGGPADNPHLLLRSPADLGHNCRDGDGSKSKSLALDQSIQCAQTGGAALTVLPSWLPCRLLKRQRYRPPLV